MKLALIILTTILTTKAFAIDSECLARVRKVITDIRPSAKSVILTELDTTEINEGGLNYLMTRVEAEGEDAKGSFYNLIIINERPSTKCIIRNIL